MTITPPHPLSAAEDRGHEILASVRHAFAEKGFDGASMQDLARAAGMSVGNFYRYFPSKAAIVEGMVGLDLAEIERDFVEIRASVDPMAGLRAKIIQRITEDCQYDGQLWAEITAAAIRKPEIAAASMRMEVAVVRHLAAIFAQVTGRTVEAAQARYLGHCELLILLIKSTTVRASQCGPASADLARLVLRTIDQTLLDVTNDTAKG
ncbi:helix-turn-helix domain-containing protein [Tabrizicola sp.]|uniref:TetR/AcrR family transcriptional regulator n=1 Tax=Tabrizicola sp. TaxID=2005166 RepID=UPI00286C34E2|nr:helix-turn-helix domain-containing protein [Tabrizicola sp.]